MTNKGNRIYLSPPHMASNEMQFITSAFEENWIAPLGPNVDAFEKSLATYCGVKDAAVVSSGTAAIHLALIILGVKPGDEIIASTFTFSATINPIVYLGAIPVLIDCEPDTWNMDPILLEEAIKDRLKKGKRPKAIIPVHLYGMPVNMEAIMNIADRYEIPVIEDAAEALGSLFKRNAAGSIGKIGILSFNGNKIITTSGGGALLSDDKEIINKARFLSTQARDKAPHYQHSQIGYNYRMSNILAGIGRGQMEVLEDRIASRRKNFMFYKDFLSNYTGLYFQNEPNLDYFSNRWLTAFVIDPKKNKITKEVIQESLEKANIESRPLWKPMHLQPVFLNCPAYISGNSERLFNNGICLPSGSSLNNDERTRIIDVLYNVFNVFCH